MTVLAGSRKRASEGGGTKPRKERGMQTVVPALSVMSLGMFVLLRLLREVPGMRKRRKETMKHMVPNMKNGFKLIPGLQQLHQKIRKAFKDDSQWDGPGGHRQWCASNTVC